MSFKYPGFGLEPVGARLTGRARAGRGRIAAKYKSFWNSDLHSDNFYNLEHERYCQHIRIMLQAKIIKANVSMNQIFPVNES